MKTSKQLFLLALTVVTLSACQNVKQELGVGRHSPDEFAVVKRAPLTLPPEYNLRPPADGSAPPAAVASNEAKTILLGAPTQPVLSGDAEDVLLGKMNTQAAEPGIRDLIDQENGYLALENKKLVDKLIFWEDKGVDEEDIPSSLVNPKAEAERLKKNTQDGKPVNEGDVPVIEKKKGTIDKIF